MKSKWLILLAALVVSPTVLSDTTLFALDRERDAVQERTFATAAGQAWFEQQRRIAAELEAEHLLATLHQGGLSNDELERIAAAFADPNLTDLLATSAYYQAVFEGRVEIHPN